MKGHRQIETLRSAGYKPSAVFVCDWHGANPDRDIEQSGLPAVYVAGDTPETSDLRFLIGCRVHLQSDDPSRAVAWVDRLLSDGASHVIQSTGGEVYQWHQ